MADAFDAMTSDRPYAARRTSQEALAELRRCAGTQFDPAVVEAFRAVEADRSTPVWPEHSASGGRCGARPRC